MSIRSAGLRAATALLLAAILAGCAALGTPGAPRGESGSDLARCEELFADVDGATAARERSDGGTARIEGHPHLRVDRFGASFRYEVLDDAGFRAWIGRLRALDRSARAAELANLDRTDPRVAALVERAGGAESLGVELERCGDRLTAADVASVQSRARLREQAAVPDDYQTWKRALGLYPITAIPFASGVRKWQAETLEVFSAPLDTLPRRGGLARYGPPGPRPTAEEVGAILDRLPADALGIREPSGADLDLLLRAYAPVLEVDTAGDFDRIGALEYGPDGALRVDTTRPAVYVRVAHTRYGGEALLQFVYTAWFPERPLDGPGDLLGGRLDGLVWRVTLDGSGLPLVFDTIHPCGCYHLFLPTGRAVPLAPPAGDEEFLFVPQRLPELPAAAAVQLRMESGTHYLQRAVPGAGAPAQTAYALLTDDSLRSLPHPAGRRSAFGPDGIVAGTERGERFLFWPMGIRDPGAMRQWGRHATAFVGRRHFDDADLMERRFLLKPGAVQ